MRIFFKDLHFLQSELCGFYVTSKSGIEYIKALKEECGIPTDSEEYSEEFMKLCEDKGIEPFANILVYRKGVESPFRYYYPISTQSLKIFEEDAALIDSLIPKGCDSNDDGNVAI